MSLSNVARRLTKAEIAREPRSLAVIAWFDGNAVGSGLKSRTTYPRRLTRDEAESWREGGRDGRRARVCHARHGVVPGPGDQPPIPPSEARTPAP